MLSLNDITLNQVNWVLILFVLAHTARQASQTPQPQGVIPARQSEQEIRKFTNLFMFMITVILGRRKTSNFV